MTAAVGLALGVLTWLAVVTLCGLALSGRRHVQALVWRGALPGRLGALPVEDVASHEAPRGWKCAQLLLSPDRDEVRLAGISIGGSYRAEDAAVCVRRRDHAPPSLDCECGFYAFERRDRAEDLLARRCGFDGDVVVRALLEVECSGTVIEHEHGIRGELQRVLGIRILPWCADCAGRGSLVHAVGLDADGTPALSLGDWGAGAAVLQQRLHDSVQLLQHWSPLRPLCDQCAPTPLLGLADLAAMLGTEVSWLDRDAVEPERVVAGHRPRRRSPR